MPSQWVNKYLLRHTSAMWSWWTPRKLARLNAQVSNSLFRCAHCKEAFPKAQVQVDHIEAIGPAPPRQSWDEYLDRKFVTADKLQVLCLQCHKKKTKEDVRKMRSKKDV